MTDLFLLSQAQMRRIVRVFSTVAWRRPSGRPSDCERDCVCDQEWASLARRPA